MLPGPHTPLKQVIPTRTKSVEPHQIYSLRASASASMELAEAYSPGSLTDITQATSGKAPGTAGVGKGLGGVAVDGGDQDLQNTWNARHGEVSSPREDQQEHSLRENQEHYDSDLDAFVALFSAPNKSHEDWGEMHSTHMLQSIKVRLSFDFAKDVLKFDFI